MGGRRKQKKGVKASAPVHLPGGGIGSWPSIPGTHDERQPLFASVTSTPLPCYTAGATHGNSPLNLASFIISPFNHYYRFWEFFVLILVFYTAGVCPFIVGFLKELKGPLAIVDNVVNGFFAFDILLTFFLGYHDRKTYLYVDSPRQIAWRYAKKRLHIDVISVIPLEFAHKVLKVPSRYGLIFIVLRLLRLHRAHAVFGRFEHVACFTWLRLLNMLFVSLLSVHIAACLFHFLVAMDDIENTWFSLVADGNEMHLLQRYVTSLYWAVVTMSTVGYGDLHPVNAKEMTCGIIYIFYLTLGLNIYLVGNMTNIIFQITNKSRNYRAAVRAAKSFARRNQLPVHLQETMLTYLFMKHKTDLQRLQKQEDLIGSLPKAVRSSISHHLYNPIVSKVYLFEGVSCDHLLQLVAEMKPQYFPPTEDVIIHGEISTDFYILVSGTAELIIQENGTEQFVRSAKVGDIVGEIGVLCNEPQLFTVRTRQLCKFLRMNGPTFLNLGRSNIEDGTTITRNFLKHLEEKSSNPKIGQILAEIRDMFHQGKTDLPVSLGFAIEEGYNALLLKLLENGSNPNKEDRNKRTPLHFALNEGNQNCVGSLLKHQADPNRKDSIESYPLHRAVHSGNIEIIKLLLQHGARIDQTDNKGYTPYTLPECQQRADIKGMFDNFRKCRGTGSSTTLSHAGSLSEHRLGQNFVSGSTSAAAYHDQDLRVTISCPDVGDYLGVAICLPQSLDELREIGNEKFGFKARQILSTRGCRIEDIRTIEKDDNLILTNLTLYFRDKL